MYISFGQLIRILLFALGVYWCCEVIGRWREDVKELREVEETARKAGIIVVWVITVVIAIVVVWAALKVILRIISSLPGLGIFF